MNHTFRVWQGRQGTPRTAVLLRAVALAVGLCLSALVWCHGQPDRYPHRSTCHGSQFHPPPQLLVATFYTATQGESTPHVADHGCASFLVCFRHSRGVPCISVTIEKSRVSDWKQACSYRDVDRQFPALRSRVFFPCHHLNSLLIVSTPSHEVASGLSFHSATYRIDLVSIKPAERVIIEVLSILFLQPSNGTERK